jgi:ATP-dependent DNA helicase RecQ
MTRGADVRTGALARILAAVRRYWGYDRLRPLQEEAIQAGWQRRDSLIVLPTGGGKSLCYQVPPALAGRTDVVVSPLISLMKDQVDGLQQCGYPAVALHSGLPPAEQQRRLAEVRAGACHLVFVAPERLLAPGFMDLLERLPVRAFAIDEAHCISHWGHDFRREYRQLAILKQRFPQASVHAYTATATERVRRDIVEQLRLVQPVVLVGRFDRPNLIYRVVPRVEPAQQVLEVIRRHRGQAVIVYCITRRDTERLAAWLQASEIRAACYHAGLAPDERRRTQERFAQEQLDVVVATVAFGMGIDRSDVRCVIHAAMPKTVEHYQQETGRAGRDGLEAECVLLYSPADALRWAALLRKRAAEAECPPEVVTAGVELLGHVRAYAAGYVCRHKVLSEYFGQPYGSGKCGACDVCLDEGAVDEEATLIAQKILSCVARVEEHFGVGHVVKVLTGSHDKLVRSFGHDQLSTFGLLRDLETKKLTSLVFQLIDQGVLERTAGDRPLLKLNAASWAVMRGERPVRLVMPRPRVVKATQIQAESWAGVDRALFESLRELRRTLATERGVPAYVIFHDATLRDMARRRPQALAELLSVHGVGERKAKTYGQRFLAQIKAHTKVGQASGLPPSATTP